MKSSISPLACSWLAGPGYGAVSGCAVLAPMIDSGIGYYLVHSCGRSDYSCCGVLAPLAARSSPPPAVAGRVFC